MKRTETSPHKPEEIPGVTAECRRHAWRVTWLYVVFGTIWIVVTDQALEYFSHSPNSIFAGQMVKGLLYVALTAALVYWLSKRAVQQAGYLMLQQQLERSKKVLDTVLANLGEAVFIVEADGRTISRCNSAVTPMFGYQEQDLVGKNTSLLHTDDEAYRQFGCAGEQALEECGVYRCQTQMKRKDGRTIDTENTVIAVDSELGWREGVVSIVRDITDRKRAVEALRRREAQYRLLAENTLDVIWAMDMDFVFTYVNAAITLKAGYGQEEFLGTDLAQHVDEDGLREFESLVKQRLQSKEGADGIFVEMSWTRKDGSFMPVEVNARVLYDSAEEPLGIQGVSRDISERLALEAQLRQSQKLEALGTLAGGVAHEINNPVMGITNYADLISDMSDEGSDIRDFAAEIKHETNRVHTIIRNLLGFARREERVSMRPVSVAQLIEDTLSLCGTLMRHDYIDLSVKLDEPLQDVLCHPQQIQQVLMNLLTNARDALNSRYPGRDPEKCAVIRAAPIDKDGRRWMRITVEDGGTGVPADVRERMFDPFFTTKPEGQGTGLGLSIAYGIICAHNGDLTVESEEGQFTRVHLDLPLEHYSDMPEDRDTR